MLDDGIHSMMPTVIKLGTVRCLVHFFPRFLGVSLR